ncbi:MAG: hypothetical protein R3B99_17370 [Polyangiales bacterium]|nr:hypothetical protein [Myxococcales bacterium]MCB9623582.1 hypothetical protein [Sandaracinus sp.]
MQVKSRLLAFLLCAFPVSVLAQAQSPTSSEMAAARQLFRSGLEHAEAGRWTDARADFERSYGLARVPVTLFNLAGAQAETGQLVTAAESYRRFLQEADEGRAARYRESAERALAELEPRIPRLRLEVNGLGEGDVLRIDDDEVSRAVLGVAFPLDPGEHLVAVVRRGDVVVDERVTLNVGEERAVTLLVPALQVRPAEVARAEVEAETTPVEVPPSRDEERSIARSPWLWIAVGVVVVAGATTAVVLATRDDASPYQGNAGVVRFELGGSR